MNRITILSGCLFTALACSTAPESVGEQTAELNGPDVNVTSLQSNGGTETSIAFGTTAAGGSVVVEANNAGDGNAAGTWAEWAVSTNGGLTFPTQNRESTLPFSNGTLIMSDGSPYKGTRGDPNVIFTGWPGVFAYITTAESVASGMTDTPMDVVVATSTDGGNNFGNHIGTGTLALVSDHQSSGADTAGGTIDMPSVYMEAAGTHVAWVSWVNINVPFNGGGKRPWVRRLHFNSNGTVTFGPPTEVRIDCNLSCVKFDSQNIAAYCDPAHAGIDNCVGGTETLVMAFPRVNNSPFNDTALIDNQAQVNCSGTLDVEWRAAISTNLGVEWKKGINKSDGSVIMGSDPLWPNCIVPSATANNGNNRGRMAVYHDDKKSLWHAYWTKETFKGTGGAASGQRVFHSRFPDTFSMGSEEINPVTNNAGTACGAPGIECFVDQFMPSAVWSPTTGSATTHVVSWHDTRLKPTPPSNGVMWTAVSKASGGIGSFTINQQLTQGTIGIPWAFTASNGNTPWGDYEGMASDGAGTFFPAYADERTGGAASQITVRAFQP